MTCARKGCGHPRFMHDIVDGRCVTGHDDGGAWVPCDCPAYVDARDVERDTVRTVQRCGAWCSGVQCALAEGHDGDHTGPAEEPFYKPLWGRSDAGARQPYEAPAVESSEPAEVHTKCAEPDCIHCYAAERERSAPEIDMVALDSRMNYYRNLATIYAKRLNAAQDYIEQLIAERDRAHQALQDALGRRGWLEWVADGAGLVRGLVRRVRR